MNKPDDKVTVLLVASERVTYRKLITMPRSEFERLDKQIDDAEFGDRGQIEEKIVDTYVDRQTDWDDSSDVEIEDFMIESEGSA